MKTLILSIALTLMAGLGHAQNFFIGPTLGINTAIMTGKSSFSQIGTVARANFGISIKYELDSHISVGTDILYSKEGRRTDPFPKPDTGNVYAILIVPGVTHPNYFRVPIKACWAFGKKDQKLRPHLSAGLSPAFVIDGKIKYEGSPLTDYIDRYRKFDIGILTGAGLNYRITEKARLNFDLQYTWGMRELSKYENPSVETKNRNLAVNLGIGFPIGAQ